MNEQKGFMQVNISAGMWIYNLTLLQILPLMYTLKGAILFGFFPSIASTFNVLYKWMVTKEYDFSIRDEFKTFYKENFWETNKLGWLMLGVGGFLGIDLFISSNFIQSVYIHTFLAVLFFVYLAIYCYLFPVFARYDLLRIRDYVKQASLIGLTSVTQTVAILLAAVVMGYVFFYVPFLLLFFGIPFMLGPICWFAVQGMLRVEDIKLNKQQI